MFTSINTSMNASQRTMTFRHTQKPTFNDTITLVTNNKFDELVTIILNDVDKYNLQFQKIGLPLVLSLGNGMTNVNGYEVNLVRIYNNFAFKLKLNEELKKHHVFALVHVRELDDKFEVHCNLKVLADQKPLSKDSSLEDARKLFIKSLLPVKSKPKSKPNPKSKFKSTIQTLTLDEIQTSLSYVINWNGVHTINITNDIVNHNGLKFSKHRFIQNENFLHDVERLFSDTVGSRMSIHYSIYMYNDEKFLSLRMNAI